MPCSASAPLSWQSGDAIAGNQHGPSTVLLDQAQGCRAAGNKQGSGDPRGL